MPKALISFHKIFQANDSLDMTSFKGKLPGRRFHGNVHWRTRLVRTAPQRTGPPWLRPRGIVHHYIALWRTLRGCIPRPYRYPPLCKPPGLGIPRSGIGL